MEVAVIDWKNLDSRFVKDDILERFNAPQWVDFSAADGFVDDEAWFCRPDCNHPKTVKDFHKAAATLTPKLQKSSGVSEIPLFRERIRRMFDDSENQNPNTETPHRFKAKLMKEAIKSSAEKKTVDDNSLPKEQQTPRLRSTNSARNLFSGVDLLSRVTEFCNELKKLTARAKEKERIGNETVERTPLMVNKQVVKEGFSDENKDLAESGKEKTPLLKKNDTMGKNILKEKQRRRNENAENTPITIDVKSAKRTGDESLSSQIRTCPPTPQCFSAGSTKATPPPKAFRSRPPGRGILQELGKSSRNDRKEEPGNKIKEASSAVIESEARGLDVFWFLKPCTLST
ncbi:PREDICTED: uncharacterized protein LOC109155727 isoform X2 [Ipomoea nil]|uniref:uncharacterized protein LOC109155727 isoform X2 n=1 Tax=Ipomoea nil TaxID=35883 RepID=UPI0009013D48|nr:PREDICTED: uncharacterized protein LOC109155727 isoform X2 [Ipomoea nil]